MVNCKLMPQEIPFQQALANLQLRLNEAVWRRGGGDDVLGAILKRVEEAEIQGIPAHHAPDA